MALLTTMAIKAIIRRWRLSVQFNWFITMGARIAGRRHLRTLGFRSCSSSWMSPRQAWPPTGNYRLQPRWRTRYLTKPSALQKETAPTSISWDSNKKSKTINRLWPWGNTTQICWRGRICWTLKKTWSSTAAPSITWLIFHSLTKSRSATRNHLIL